MKRVFFIALISSLMLVMPACGQTAAEEPETSSKAEMDASIQETEPAPVKENKACWACGGRENCVHQKDCFREIFEKMKEADGILLGSPVYSANVSANMQALLERAAVVGDMNPGLLVHKAGAAVTAARRGGALQAIDTMTHFFLNHEMYVAGSTYWNMGYGQMPGDVENDQEALANMENLGQNMAYLLKALGEGRQ